jgi:DNA-binding MarR family transcriptional regulator
VIKPELQAQCWRAARDCTASTLRRASRAVSSIYDEQMAKSGLRTTQFNLLTAVALAGDMPLTRLAGLLGLDRTTLTRNLGPLETGGLLVSVPTEDRRVRLVRMTAKGRSALERAMPLWEAAQDHVVRSLGDATWRKLHDALAAVAEIAPNETAVAAETELDDSAPPNRRAARRGT